MNLERFYNSSNTIDANYMTNTTSHTYSGSGTSTTYGPSNSDTVSNICKILFDQMLFTKPERFQNILNGQNSPYGPNTNGRSGENYLTGTYNRIPIPFIAGDSITFAITYKPNSGQSSITNNASGSFSRSLIPNKFFSSLAICFLIEPAFAATPSIFNPIPLFEPEIINFLFFKFKFID